MNKELIAELKMLREVLHLVSVANENKEYFNPIVFIAIQHKDEHKVSFIYRYYYNESFGSKDSRIKDEDGMIYQAFKNYFKEIINESNVVEGYLDICGREFTLKKLISMVYNKINAVAMKENDCPVFQKELEMLNIELENANKVESQTIEEIIFGKKRKA